MSDAIEREVKLGAWAAFELPDLDGVVVGSRAELLPALRLTATYYDTVDLRLARWGVTVRHRASVPATDELAWTVKLPAGLGSAGSLSRRELGFEGPEHRMPPGLVSLVRGLSRNAALVPVARLRTDRRRWELRDAAGAALTEIADDEVSVMVSGAGGRGRRLAARFRELEVELVGSDDTVLPAVVARLRAAGAGEPDPTPKVVRALGPRALEPPDVVVAPVGRRSTAGDVIQACLGSSVTRLFRHDAGVRLGGDIEDVHQARVATRRLRSDLRTFAPLLDEGWTRELRDELGWIAALLGDVRDADVLLERLHGHARRLPKGDAVAAETLLRRLDRQQHEATQVLHAAMDSERYTTLLDRLVVAAAAPRFRRPEAAARPDAARLDPATRPAPPPDVAARPDPPTRPDAARRSDDAVRSDPLTGDPRPLEAGPLDGVAIPVTTAMPAAPRGWGSAAVLEHAAPAAGVEGDGPPGPEDAPVAAPIDVVEGPGPADEPAGAALPALVRRPWRHLERAMVALGPAPEDDALHAARILAKRCRYAAEAVAPALGRDPAKMAEAVAGLQGVLGDLHDTVVAEAWLRQAVVRGPAAQALAAGQLIAMERVEAETCRRAWRGVWKQASGRKLRAWLNP